MLQQRYVYKCTRCGTEQEGVIEFLVCVKTASRYSEYHMCFQCLGETEKWLTGRDELIREPEKEASKCSR